MQGARRRACPLSAPSSCQLERRAGRAAGCLAEGRRAEEQAYVEVVVVASARLRGQRAERRSRCQSQARRLQRVRFAILRTDRALEHRDVGRVACGSSCSRTGGLRCSRGRTRALIAALAAVAAQVLEALRLRFGMNQSVRACLKNENEIARARRR